MRQTVLEAVYRYGDTVAGVSRGGAYRCPACGKVLALRNHDGSVAARCGRARWVLQTGRQVVTCWGDDCHALVAITAGEAADAA